MGNISTSIALYDRVSAPIMNMIGAINNVCYAFESVETAMDGAFNPSDITRAREHINQAAAQMTALGEEIEQNENKQRGFNNEIKQGANDADALTNKVMGLVGAYAGFQGIKKLVNLSDEYTQTTARLNMINDGLQTNEELQDKIFASAQRSRTSYQNTADIVAKLSLRAGDAFGSNDEAIAFAETLNKMYVISGTSQQEMASASLQLTQALGSGVLRGEEFNAVFEAAPNVMQAVADYMDVPIGKLRGMAADGQITADIVKNALFSATDDINAQFESMPMTWGQVWTGVMNELYMTSQPVLELINLLANNWSVLEPIVIGLATAVGIYTAALITYNTIKSISALLEGVHAAKQAFATGVTFAEVAATQTATGAQIGFNAALLACPLTWILLIIIAVIAAIYAVVAAINKVTGSTLSATGIIVGALMTAVAFVWNLFLSLVDLVLGCVNAIANPWIAWANFFGNLFNDPVASIIHLFGDMADNILGILESIAKAIDKVFGSDLAGSVQGWRSGLDGWIEKAAEKHGNGSYEKVMDNLNLSSESLGLKRWAYSDAYKTGYSWGEGIGDSVSGIFGGIGTDLGETGYDTSQIPSNISDTAENTGKAADSLEITSEDLKYLRDIAETEAVNRFTTAEIKVEMTNHNNISSDMDLDGVVDHLATSVNEAMEKAAEGVHE